MISGATIDASAGSVDSFKRPGLLDTQHASSRLNETGDKLVPERRPHIAVSRERAYQCFDGKET